MSEGGEFSFESMTKPWVEELVLYGLRYNVEARTCRDGIEILRKAASNRDFDTCVNVLAILISNAQSPPKYFCPIPADAVPINVLIYDSGMLRRAGVSVRGSAETYGVVLFFCFREGRSLKNCTALGYKLHWHESMGVFFTEPMTLHELKLLSERTEVEEGGETEEGGGRVDLEEEGAEKAEEEVEHEPVPEGLEGAELYEE